VAHLDSLCGRKLMEFISLFMQQHTLVANHGRTKAWTSTFLFPLSAVKILSLLIKNQSHLERLILRDAHVLQMSPLAVSNLLRGKGNFDLSRG